eukprot:7166992-Prymnesium_polylepis.1
MWPRAPWRAAEPSEAAARVSDLAAALRELIALRSLRALRLHAGCTAGTVRLVRAQLAQLPAEVR